jgi:hypothetical protein
MSKSLAAWISLSVGGGFFKSVVGAIDIVISSGFALPMFYMRKAINSGSVEANFLMKK